MNDNDEDFTAPNESNRFGGRVRRYAKVGASAESPRARASSSSGSVGAASSRPPWSSARWRFLRLTVTHLAVLCVDRRTQRYRGLGLAHRYSSCCFSRNA